MQPIGAAMRTYAIPLAFLLVIGSGVFWFTQWSVPTLPDVSPPPPASGEGATPPPPAGAQARLPDGQGGAAIPPASSAAGITLASVKTCLGKGGESSKCLDGLFQAYLKTNTTVDALKILQAYEDTDTDIRLACHPVTHAIGRETFRKTGTVHDSFAACDQTCHSGCYHGAMERFLRGDAADDETHVSERELFERAVSACDPDQATRFRFQCLHGLGHALMFFLDYQLERALAGCDEFGDAWSRSSCYGGVFMENVHTATPEKRDLSATDYHYPCSKLSTKYKSDCYMMQTTRMAEMGLSTERQFEECRTAGSYAHTCMQSIGRDLSNTARIGNPRDVAADCERGITAEERQACTRGVAYALVDNTWDGRYAFPFCAAFAGATDQNYCFSVSISYLRSTYAKTADSLVAECRQYAPAAAVCVETVR